MWLARNKDNSYVLVEDEVTLARIDKNGNFVKTPEEGIAWYDDTGMHDVPCFHTCKNYFPDLKWESDPIEVSLIGSEFKELVISWFDSIKSNLDAKFPTRFTESLEGRRGSELDAVNEEIARCSRCIEFIEKFL